MITMYYLERVVPAISGEILPEHPNIPHISVEEYASILGFRTNLLTFRDPDTAASIVKVNKDSNGQSQVYEIPERFLSINLNHSKINRDYVGVLAIPQLGIEDTLYFSNSDYYLTHDYLGNKNKAGEIYIDGRSTGNLFAADNLINGHSMNNGAKFGKLPRIFKMEENVYIYILDYRTGRTFMYEVFAANIVSNNNSGVMINFNSSYERILYYKSLKAQSVLHSNTNDFTPNIITLNTCDYSLENGHLLVSAILVRIL
jgi:sortase B